MTLFFSTIRPGHIVKPPSTLLFVPQTTTFVSSVQTNMIGRIIHIGPCTTCPKK